MRKCRILFGIILATLGTVFTVLPMQGSPSPTLPSIAVYPSSSGGFGSSDGVLTQGTEVPFFATGSYSDNSTEDLTTSVTWASSETSAATQASMSLTPTLLSFGNQAFDTTSTAKQVTLTSAGTSNLTISSIAMTGTNAGNFAQSNNCPASLAPAARCIIDVTYTPSVMGRETATLTVTGVAANGRQTISLSGTSIVQASASPTSWAFGSQPMGGKCDAKSVTLTNNLPTVLKITSTTFTGADPGDFSQTNACGKSLAAKSQCTIFVTFIPRAKGSRSATLNVNDSVNNRPQTVTLTGTGE